MSFDPVVTWPCSHVLDQASTAGLRDVSPSTEHIGTSGVGSIENWGPHPPLVIIVSVDVFISTPLKHIIILVKLNHFPK